MEVVIDRFEGEYAVVELPDCTTGRISKTLLPEAREGDVVEITINKTATGKRKKKIDQLADELWES
ncbi:MAG TPA: DUF3006 domain-containing protein [Bacillota bacterium]|nr:DUF3006 domain-containing protein [Bacillota bacterium]